MNNTSWHPPKRSLGQNFLADFNTARWIVRQAGILPTDLVIEIGPGRGMLTRALIPTGAEIFAIEKDKYLASHLKKTFKKVKKLTFLEGDAARFPWDTLAEPEKRAIVMGNLPYNVASQILWRLLPRTNLFKRWLFLFQKEVADRLCAPVGSRSYGALSVFVQSVTRPSLLKVLPPSYFIPPPQVDSALVAFQMIPMSPPTPMQDNLFIQIVKTAFSHRRKMLRNNLKNLFQSLNIASEFAFEQAGVKGSMRAQELTVRHYVHLTDTLRKVT